MSFLRPRRINDGQLRRSQTYRVCAGLSKWTRAHCEHGGPTPSWRRQSSLSSKYCGQARRQRQNRSSLLRGRSAEQIRSALNGGRNMPSRSPRRRNGDWRNSATSHGARTTHLKKEAAIAALSLSRSHTKCSIVSGNSASTMRLCRWLMLWGRRTATSRESGSMSASAGGSWTSWLASCAKAHTGSTTTARSRSGG